MRVYCFCRLEIIMLLLVYLAYGYEKSSVSYIILSFSSWFLALSWLFAPYIFNPSGFEWQKYVHLFISLCSETGFIFCKETGFITSRRTSLNFILMTPHFLSTQRFPLYLLRTIDDFDNWTNWLLYRGGVGVKADDSWETWWEEEQVRISFMTFPTKLRKYMISALLFY